MVLIACSGFPSAGAAQEREASKLVVLVVVDQLPGDLLERYDEAFTGGFRRLMDGGMYFTRATHDHARTATAPGHTTLATGVYPSRHGIVGNEWTVYDRQGGVRREYAVEDEASPLIDEPGFVGSSPANIDREGLASWILAKDKKSRSFSVSHKDRAAIGMMAKERGEVYWLSARKGRFVTSVFYREDYPRWVRRFNDRVMPKVFSDTIWENSVPASLRGLARPDESEWEGAGTHSTFPHVMRSEAKGKEEVYDNLWRAETPIPDLAVLRLAQTALTELDLGQSDRTDFLAVSFSQADYIGHQYGPRSLEQFDNLLRLDQRLGELMDSLDEQVGEGKWVLGFSSDHGVLAIPEYLEPPGRRMTRARQQEIYAPVQDLFETGLRGAELQREVIEVMEGYDEVMDGISFSEINGGQVPADSFRVLFSRSFHPDRTTSPLGRLEIQIRWAPGFLDIPVWKHGTTHESPYYYDRWVPLIFYGAGVSAGRSDGPASSVDVAPTLAALAGIPVPDDLDGLALIGAR